MERLCGNSDVPQIFFNEVHIGDEEGLKALVSWLVLLVFNTLHLSSPIIGTITEVNTVTVIEIKGNCIAAV